jgi:hypothetical protein
VSPAPFSRLLKRVTRCLSELTSVASFTTHAPQASINLCGTGLPQ